MQLAVFAVLLHLKTIFDDLLVFRGMVIHAFAVLTFQLNECILRHNCI